MSQLKAELALSPEGHVYLNENAHALESLPELVLITMRFLFCRDTAYGLLQLGILDFTLLPASFLFWHRFARTFVTHVCRSVGVAQQELPHIATPTHDELQEMIDRALPFNGIEYLNVNTLETLWNELLEVLRRELRTSRMGLQAYLQLFNSSWNLVGRVCFHLAENKKDERKPFAFLATYTTQLSLDAKAQHLPLKRALEEYAGENNHQALLALLMPVQRAAETSAFIKSLLDDGSLFQPQLWTIRQGHSFLKEIPVMEASGILVRVPNWWNAQKPPRPRVTVRVGDRPSSVVGLSTLLDFDVQIALDNGTELTAEEWRELMHSQDNLVKIKETWVEVDREKLSAMLSHWEKIKQGARNGLSMRESMRLLSGSFALDDEQDKAPAESCVEWSHMVAGEWLKSVLAQLRSPQNCSEQSLERVLQKHLKGTLRPYQMSGVQWLWLLYRLKLGGCLADDMGLGKTIQVLSFLLLVKYHPDSKHSSKFLLIVPASLIGNWQAEARRFAPDLRVLVAHTAANSAEEFKNLSDDALTQFDIVITTYGNIYRLTWLKEITWNVVVLDEAQHIKNPSTKQSRAVKELKSEVRFTLTGTPIENRLGDLWSLFDFTSPGLLGSSKVFSNYVKQAGRESHSANYSRFVTSLRGLTQPYILRRLKSDKSIIADLPDKTEVQSFCALSKEQIKLYQQSVDELSQLLEKAEGIQRQGLVLSYLARFKQICNHPAQWLGYGEYAKEASGKFIRLEEICEEIAAKQEKVLLFTQFKEVIPALAAHLTTIFGREGLVLHGGTSIKQRPKLVDSFQQEQGPPFFILSLKAGGTGLNLTRASHVIHFDRWWNPAVENQATDRAYRIGQKHPVLVHKFVCRGTIEERIDEMISSKQNLSKEILEGDREVPLTELSNEQLLDLISLDIKKAMGE